MLNFRNRASSSEDNNEDIIIERTRSTNSAQSNNDEENTVVKVVRRNSSNSGINLMVTAARRILSSTNLDETTIKTERSRSDSIIRGSRKVSFKDTSNNMANTSTGLSKTTSTPSNYTYTSTTAISPSSSSLSNMNNINIPKSMSLAPNSFAVIPPSTHPPQTNQKLIPLDKIKIMRSRSEAGIQIADSIRIAKVKRSVSNGEDRVKSTVTIARKAGSSSNCSASSCDSGSDNDDCIVCHPHPYHDHIIPGSTGTGIVQEDHNHHHHHHHHHRPGSHHHEYKNCLHELWFRLASFMDEEWLFLSLSHDAQRNLKRYVCIYVCMCVCISFTIKMLSQ